MVHKAMNNSLYMDSMEQIHKFIELHKLRVKGGPAIQFEAVIAYSIPGRQVTCGTAHVRISMANDNWGTVTVDGEAFPFEIFHTEFSPHWLRFALDGADLLIVCGSNLNSSKYINSPFVVTLPKKNHPSSYFNKCDVCSDVPFGNTTLSCEIRNQSPHNYSFSYCSDEYDEHVLARLDMGDGTHNNRVPGIPLSETSVPTPHVHKFRSDGRLIAYRIEGVDYSDESSIMFDYEQGYDYFCELLHIRAQGGENPKFYFLPQGQIDFRISDKDPNENVIFPNQEDMD